MEKAAILTVFSVISTLFILQVGNFLIHGLIYAVDGSLDKFWTPWWICLNSIMALFAIAFALLLRKINTPTPPVSKG